MILNHSETIISLLCICFGMLILIVFTMMYRALVSVLFSIDTMVPTVVKQILLALV